MKKIAEHFAKTFDIPLPAALVSDMPLIPIGPDLKPHLELDPDDVWLLASAAASKERLPLIMSAMESWANAQADYYLMGFFDHGINNCGFYYAIVDSWRRVYFRINYAGVYTDSKKEAGRFREFLPRYLEFEGWLTGRVQSLAVVVVGGSDSYRVELKDGRQFERRFMPGDTLLDRPDFDVRFSELLALVGCQQ